MLHFNLILDRDVQVVMRVIREQRGSVESPGESIVKMMFVEVHNPSVITQIELELKEDKVK